ncbi:monooxygenase [Balamuthia mandrillaris]
MGKSGSDIAEELLPVCSKLLLCSARWKIYHSMLESSSSTSLSDFFPILQAEKVVATGVPSRLDGRTLIWDDAEDGDETETGCDIIIYCTGYEFDFEFLDEDGEDILVIKQAVKSVATSSYIPLYQFMMPPSHPTLAIIALHPVAEAQGKRFAQMLSSRVPFPTEQEMRRSVKHWEEQVLLRPRNYRVMEVEPAAYIQNLLQRCVSLSRT